MTPAIGALAVAGAVAAIYLLFYRRRARRAGRFGALPASWLQERRHLEQRVDYEGAPVKWSERDWGGEKRRETKLKIVAQIKDRKRA